MAWGDNEEEPVPSPVPAKPGGRTRLSRKCSPPISDISTRPQRASRTLLLSCQSEGSPANKIVSESRIGYSVCSLLDHIRNWDAWSKRDDFSKYVAFPATDVSGTRDKTDKNHDGRTIDFRYPPECLDRISTGG
jgi:hypothetical protein